MSLLTQASLGMSALLADRQRNPAAAGAAASWEWPGQDARVARLMVRAAEAEQLATVPAEWAMLALAVAGILAMFAGVI